MLIHCLLTSVSWMMAAAGGFYELFFWENPPIFRHFAHVWCLSHPDLTSTEFTLGLEQGLRQWPELTFDEYSYDDPFATESPHLQAVLSLQIFGQISDQIWWRFLAKIHLFLYSFRKSDDLKSYLPLTGTDSIDARRFFTLTSLFLWGYGSNFWELVPRAALYWV